YYFSFTSPSPTQIYTLSLHDALPISGTSPRGWTRAGEGGGSFRRRVGSASAGSSPPADHATRAPPQLIPGARPVSGNDEADDRRDRKSTRLNSSHVKISYAVFCLKKK